MDRLQWFSCIESQVGEVVVMHRQQLKLYLYHLSGNYQYDILHLQTQNASMVRYGLSCLVGLNSDLPSPPLWIFSTEILFQNFPIFHNILLNLENFGGRPMTEKHADPRKKDGNSRKSRENSRNLLEAFLRFRKEENLYGHCNMINVRRILSKGSTLWRGCWVWSKKLHFQKNFGWNFIAVEGVRLEINEDF